MSADPDMVVGFVPPMEALIDEFVATLGFGENPGALRRLYRREIFRLAAKSDAELFLMGIRRAEIPAYVMRHRYPAHRPRMREAC